MPKIDCLYAFIAEDTGPDDEGIVSAGTEEGWLPLVGAGKDRIDSLRPLAEEIATVSGKTIKLARFTVRTDVELIQPKG